MTSTALRTSTAAEVNSFEVHTFEEWQNRMSNRFVRVQISTNRPSNFHAVLQGRSFDDITLSRFEAKADQKVDRLQQFIWPGEPRHIKLSMILGGSGLIVQDGREALLGPGDMAIYDTSRPYTAVFDDSADSLVMVFPQEALSVPGEQVGQLTATSMSSSLGMGRMVGPFLKELADSLASFSGHAGTMLVYNTLDLINTLIYTELDLGQRRADPKSDALATVKEYIDRHLRDTRLSPATIAAAHFMSTRRLHYLFEGAGVTVTNWIKSRRLERCRMDLKDPALGAVSITQVAARWGFADSAHFSRAFKSGYGISPSRFRNTAAG
jgi:AraC-like DNA-binding protein